MKLFATIAATVAVASAAPDALCKDLGDPSSETGGDYYNCLEYETGGNLNGKMAANGAWCAGGEWTSYGKSYFNAVATKTCCACGGGENVAEKKINEIEAIRLHDVVAADKMKLQADTAVYAADEIQLKADMALFDKVKIYAPDFDLVYRNECGAENGAGNECLHEWKGQRWGKDTLDKHCVSTVPAYHINCLSCEWCKSEVTKPVIPLSRCDTRNCANWECKEWCHCFDEKAEHYGLYEHHGCGSDGSDVCKCDTRSTKLAVHISEEDKMFMQSKHE